MSSVPVVLLVIIPFAISRWEEPELLSELPIEKLLLQKRATFSELGTCNASKSGPEAAALVHPLDHMQIRGNPVDRGHYEEPEVEEEEEWEWMPMGKGKGLGQIFDKSVTALAFLAFGGYLVCLIIHAVKEKHDDDDDDAMKLQLLLNQYRPGTGSVPLVNLRPGRRRRRDLMATDPVLTQLIDVGYLFAEAVHPYVRNQIK